MCHPPYETFQVSVRNSHWLIVIIADPLMCTAFVLGRPVSATVAHTLSDWARRRHVGTSPATDHSCTVRALGAGDAILTMGAG